MHPHQRSHPTARSTRIDHRRRLPLIWAIPVVTVIIGAWLAWSTISHRGPLITITFETAEGLQADSRTSSTRTWIWASCRRSP